MAFDGAYLHKIKQEIDLCKNGHVDKISQPDRETLVIVLRSGSNRKLLISASAAAAKIHFTKNTIENPKTAPMFCMLMRKYLSGAKFLGTEQHGLDRILTLIFEGTNELGDRVQYRLICEIMGRRSNIILTDGNGRIIDAVKRVDFVTSEVRQILPGMKYAYPPAQSKLNPAEVSAPELARAVLQESGQPLSKAILSRVEGLSPMLCREVSAFVCGSHEIPAGELSGAQQERLEFYLNVVKTALEPGSGTPCIIRDPSGKAVDFTILHPCQFPDSYPVTELDSFSAALDEFFGARDIADRMRQKSADLHKLLVNARDRLTRKLTAQRQELLDSENRDQKREFGDIISANLYRIQKGDTVLRAVDFFRDDQPEIDIPLNPMLTPSKNAQRYYNEYKKLTTAQAHLTQLISSGEQELLYLDTVLEELSRAETEAELQSIRDEVAGQGYGRTGTAQQSSRKPLKLPPHRYLSSDGFTILSGRNNLQNDQLTLKEARGCDLWFHVKQIPGSHTVILSDGVRDIPDSTIEEAAVIAACNSSARDSGAKIPVDYTQIRNVKKPRGARPGMVIYDHYQTALVQPDLKRAEALRSK